MASQVLKMPSIAFVVARSYPQRVIGCENRLPWRLSTDMKFFRHVTEEHAIIMGRRTFDSIGHPLTNRFNIILSRQEGNWSNNLAWVKDRESALFFADYFSILNSKTQLVVIGGSEIYNVFSDLVNKIFLTEVFAEFDKGDAFFNLDFDRRRWRTLEEKDYLATDRDEFPFRISILERRLKKVRQRDISEFLVEDPALSEWKQTDFTKVAGKFESLSDEQYHLPMPSLDARWAR